MTTRAHFVGAGWGEEGILTHIIFHYSEIEKIPSVHSEGGLDGLRQDIGLAMEYLSLLSWSWGRVHFAIVLMYIFSAHFG